MNQFIERGRKKSYEAQCFLGILASENFKCLIRSFYGGHFKHNFEKCLYNNVMLVSSNENYYSTINCFNDSQLYSVTVQYNIERGTIRFFNFPFSKTILLPST